MSEHKVPHTFCHVCENQTPVGSDRDICYVHDGPRNEKHNTVPETHGKPLTKTYELPTADNPVEPNHYTEMAISPLEYIDANPEAFSWCTANVIKYVSRSKKKNGLEDLRKALWYLNHEIDNLTKES